MFNNGSSLTSRSSCLYKLLFTINSLADSMNNCVGFLDLFQSQTTGFIKKFIVQLTESDHESSLCFLAPIHENENSTRQTKWIRHVFTPKILKWTASMQTNNDRRKKSAFDSIESLSLINLSEYNQLYNELKVKYGEHMIKART